jgi:hypothetical protein
VDIERIVNELRIERDRIERAIAALESGAGTGPKNGRRGFGRRRRHMSAAARRKISIMMKKRWAERKRKSKAA